MNKQMANFGRRLSSADMKKMLGGGGGVGSGGTGGFKCYPYTGPCISTYTPGGQDCCKTCCSRSCYRGQQEDPVCSGVIIDP
jgi:hypothetical protein